MEGVLPSGSSTRGRESGEPDGRETEHFGARHRFFIQTDAKDQLNRRREILKHSDGREWDALRGDAK